MGTRVFHRVTGVGFEGQSFTDKEVEHLKNLERLKEFYANNTNISDGAIDDLNSRFPNLLSKSIPSPGMPLFMSVNAGRAKPNSGAQ